MRSITCAGLNLPSEPSDWQISSLTPAFNWSLYANSASYSISSLLAHLNLSLTNINFHRASNFTVFTRSKKPSFYLVAWSLNCSTVSINSFAIADNFWNMATLSTSGILFSTTDSISKSMSIPCDSDSSERPSESPSNQSSSPVSSCSLECWY